MSTALNTPGHYARQLTEEETEKLEKDKVLLTEFKRNKLETDAQKNWDLFYKRNTTKFFKDRHWTTREFTDLCGLNTITLQTDRVPALLEVGCGVGNFIFPLVEEKSNFFIHACDFSKRAIDFVKNHPLYNPEVVNAFVCDITTDRLADSIQESSVDIVSMIFVLSAIQPEKMVSALKNVREVLKPGGILIFRDYGLYDQAMLRFSPGHKLDENFYVRQDGTRAYYFSEEILSNICREAGFIVIENKYVQRQTVNKKEGINVARIFIQGRFANPLEECHHDSSQEITITS